MTDLGDLLRRAGGDEARAGLRRAQDVARQVDRLEEEARARRGWLRRRAHLGYILGDILGDMLR